MVQDDTPITLIIDNDKIHITLGDFIRHNQFTDIEINRIVDQLSVHGNYQGGGGAAIEWEIVAR